jgi:hypothetical protein
MRFKAMSEDEKVVAKWSGSNGNVLVLVEGTRGTRIFLKTAFARNYKLKYIVAGRKANGGPVFSYRPSLWHAERFAEANGFEQVSV